MKVNEDQRRIRFYEGEEGDRGVQQNRKVKVSTGGVVKKILVV